MAELQYLLDTDICIYIAKHKPRTVLKKFEKLSVGQTAMSLITYGELCFGAEKSQHKDRALKLIEELTASIQPLPVPLSTAKYYAKVRAALAKEGVIIGNNDLWIAAHCLSLGITLVTNNIKEFARVPDLDVVTWT